MSRLDESAIGIILASSYRRRHASSPPPLPSDLYLWLAHDVGMTLSGSRITAWQDVRNGRTLSEVSSNGPSTVVVSGRTGANFTGGTKYLQNLAIPAGLARQNVTIFARAKTLQTDLANYGTVIAIDDASGILQQYGATSTHRVFAGAANYEPAGTFYDTEEIYQARVSSTLIGIRSGLGAWGTLAKTSTAGTSSTIRLGMWGANQQPYKGAIIDLLLYNKVLSDAEADAVVNWMNSN